jgi:hypothetical protein
MLQADLFKFDDMKPIVVCLAVVMICACGPRKQKYESEVKAIHTTGPVDKVTVTETVGYDTVTQFIASLAKERDLDAGKQAIVDFLTQHYPSFNATFLKAVDMHTLRAELLERIEEPLDDSPPGDDIHALYFGLYISDRPQFSPSKRPVTIIYITGSRRTPAIDKDGWTNDPAYFPEEKYYIILDAFTKINRVLDGYTQTDHIEEIIFSGMVNLIIGNVMPEIKEYSGLEDFYIGAGFDEATIFSLGKVQ